MYTGANNPLFMTVLKDEVDKPCLFSRSYHETFLNLVY